MSAPFFSVIIPAREAAISLKLCLESIAASSFRDLEVVVVDDGSRDGTGEIAVGLADQVVRLEAPCGPARARNLAAECAEGNFLFFTDADCVLHRETLAKTAAYLQAHPEADALIGSYDAEPAEKNFFSQFKNLFHHYVHQTSSEDAATFWTGCGAIRKERFLELGGFDSRTYSRPSIEDIELGGRLISAGGVIRLRKDIQVKHLKKWSLASLLITDIFDRGIPWTRLLLRTRSFRADLNLQSHNRWSVVLVWAAVIASFSSFVYRPVLFAVPLMLAAILFLNYRLYMFFAAHRGHVFAAASVPVHMLYYFYNGISLLLGTLCHLHEIFRPPVKKREKS